MNFYKFLILLPITLASTSVFSQSKSFTFSEIKARNNQQQWGKSQIVSTRTACFSPTEITLDVDKNYHLNIISRTDLPKKGVIYLCTDDAANSVTVMLINNVKMYLYSKSKRFLINFDNIYGYNSIADLD